MKPFLFRLRHAPHRRLSVLAVLLCSATAAVTLLPESPNAYARPSRHAPKKTEAEMLADEAIEAAKQKDYDRADEMLVRAEKLEAGPRWLIARASIRADAGEILHARSMLRHARDTAETDAQKGQLEVALAEVEGRIPVVRVEITGPALSGRRLEVDGTVVPAVVQRNLEFDPGVHTFRATAPGYLPVTKKLDLTEGEVRNLYIAMTSEPVPDATVESEPLETDWPRTFGYGSFVLAGAAAVTGAVFYLQRRSHLSDAESRFSSCNPRGCSTDERSTIDALDERAARDGTVAVVGFGAAALAAGTGLWLLADDMGVTTREQPDLAVHPFGAGASVVGRF